MPDPGFGDSRTGRLQDKVPLGHHERGNNWEGYVVGAFSKAEIGAAEQNSRYRPGKIPHPEPQRAHHHRDGADMRKVGRDLEVVVTEGKARRRTEVLHAT